MKYRVVVEGRTFEIQVGPDGQVWVNRRPLNVDLEGIDGLPQYSLLVNHRSYEAHVEGAEKGECRLVIEGRPYKAALDTERRQPVHVSRPQHMENGPVEISAPLPGLLVEVRAAEGQPVEKGDVVAVLESMKMNLELCAPHSGIVKDISATPGQEVCQGDTIATIGSTKQDPQSSENSE